MAEQPMPTTGGQNVTPIARSLFWTLLKRREARGVETYGTTLQTHNGRNPYQDAMEEAIDLWQYLVQAKLEHDDLCNAIATLRTEIERLQKIVGALLGEQEARPITDDEKKQAEAASWRAWQTAWGNTESGAHAHGWEHGYEAGYQAAGTCPDETGHICANHPLHAQAKIVKQRMEIEELKGHICSAS